MSKHPYQYSMVVDWLPTHPYQSEILLFTLEKFGAVPRDRIVVQCTDRISGEVRSTLLREGYAVSNVIPYLDRMYCNKIAQLDYFIERTTDGIEGVFLLDLDLAILSALDIPDPGVVWGKIVDGANPSLSVLERLFSKAGVELPAIVPCDWEDRGQTIATNFNGGFLYVPRAFMERLRAAWRKWAEFLFPLPEISDHPSVRKHIDQISFAMAVASERIPYRHLPTNWNFPCHEARNPHRYRRDEDLRVLHYHTCLDPFGLLAPEFSDAAAVDAAVERINAAIGRRGGTIFFDMYKRHLAQEAVRDVSVMAKTMFSADFIARTWIGSRKRRLILHGGTPKTGTSSLQRQLNSNRQVLVANGWWYPPPDTSPPKHQKINSILRNADERAFAEYVEVALRDMPDDTHTIFFTTEGIFNHWWDYELRAKAMLRDLAALFDFELCVWFRPPEYFAAAFYAQNIRNPNTTDTPKNVYGQDIEFTDAMNDGWFRRHLDYLGFYHETRYLFGADRVKAFLFAGDMVQTFVDRYGIRGLTIDHRWWNQSMRRPGIEIMRVVNRFQLSKDEHLRAVNLVQEIDDVVGDRAERFRLSEDDRKLVAQYGLRGWEILQQMLCGQTAGCVG